MNKPFTLDPADFPDFQRRAAARQEGLPACEHAPLEIAPPSGDHCEECGSRINLRLCAQCGHVGCCESQAGHGRAHALGQHHPVIYSMPVGRGFAWCYDEERYVG